MTDRTISLLFEYGKKVYNKELNLNTAVQQACIDNNDVAESSARTYILLYSKMRKGEYVTWNLNSDLLLYYARKIIEENGKDVGQLAISSAIKHAKHVSRTKLEDSLHNLADEKGIKLEIPNNKLDKQYVDKPKPENSGEQPMTAIDKNYSEDYPQIPSAPPISLPHNRITFGAPGTGKSFQLNEDAKVFGTNFERVTFHPNYSYAQFVGTYKPTMSEPNKKTLSDEQQRILSILQDANKTSQEKYDLLYENFKDGDLTRLPILLGLFTDDNFKTKKADGTPAVGDNSVERNHGKAIRPYVNLPIQDSSDEKQITYQYVPGPFMRVYAAAKQNQNQNFLLIVEEINRANVAAVFGDIFQLLDREDGVSEYPVAASEDIKKYLKQNGIDEDKLSIPSNMYIWATMNSADQGVFPMDTAFKRRWEFEYIGIDENEEEVKEYWIPINDRQKVKWNDLRKAINKKLISMKINEDKLLGPFFLSRTVLENAMEDGEKFIRLFKSKVLMYLFEDAAKMKPAELFDVQERIFSVICNEFDEKGTKVFKFDAEIDVVDIEESNSIEEEQEEPQE